MPRVQTTEARKLAKKSPQDKTFSSTVLLEGGIICRKLEWVIHGLVRGTVPNLLDRGGALLPIIFKFADIYLFLYFPTLAF